MKKLIIVMLSSIVFACSKPPQNFTKIFGNIKNAKSKKLTILGENNYKKDISLDENGNFKDTLHIKKGFFALNNDVNQTYLYLKTGDNLNIIADADDFSETISFTGEGSGANNYISKKTNYEKKANLDNLKSFFVLKENDFKTQVENLEKNYNKLLSDAKNLDSSFIKNEKISNGRIISFLNKNYTAQHANYATLMKGTISPTFNYENYKGGKTSLGSLKGKYVYLDIWATWCGPCKRQIPYLKDIEEEYKDKNITFVSISIDKQENKPLWKKMVADKKLTGIQLISNNDWSSKFVTDYKIMGIPRFILIDPEGKIVDSNAPRPSQPELKTLFKSLEI